MVAPIWRECYVMGCLTLNHLATGFVLGFPAILTPALTSNITDCSTSIHVTKEQASWITAAYGMTGPIGFLILPGLMQLYGRRFINILINLITFTGSVIIASSPNVHTLITGRSLQGIAFGSLYITSILAAEYSHPKRRGFFMVFKITASSLGVLICHGLGFTISWRQMAWLASIPPALAAVGTLKWQESPPPWLAYKGRYEESVKAFELLRGSDVESKKEIRELILAQKEILRSLQRSENRLESISAMRTKEFLKPFAILAILVLLIQACGRHYLLAYLIEIMVTLTEDRSQAFYYTICLDVMKTIAVLLSSGIVRVFNRRTLLFSSGALACILLSLMCIFHYLNSIGISGLRWLTPVLLILYTFVCHIGIIPISIVLKGELFPLKLRGLGTCVIGIIYSLLSMSTLKLTSTMLGTLDIHGTFAIYLIVAIISLIGLYFILPETKDRTMQDIEKNFIDLKLDQDGDTKDITYELVNRKK